MKDSASVVIIGGGVIGTSVAYHLGLKGLRDIVLLEQNTLASGSSSKSDGIVERQFVSEFDIVLRVKSFEILQNFFNNKGVDFFPIGYIRMTCDEKDVPKYQESVRIQERLGVTDSRVLERDEIKKILPFVRVDDVACALYSPSDGMTDGSLLANSFAREGRGFDAEIVQQVRVIGIEKSANRGYRIRTNQGDINCDYVVNAAGAWASLVGKMAGIEIPVKPVRRQIVSLKVPYENAGKIPFFIDMKSRLYMHGAGGSSNSVHGGIHLDMDVDKEPRVDPDNFDSGVDFKFVELVASAIENRAPGLSGATVNGGWAGLYEITPDARPIIDEHPELPGFVNCTGFSGYGIQLSAIAGKLASELVADGKTETIEDISPLKIGRFRNEENYSLF